MLQKIGLNNKDESSSKIEATEVKKEVPTPMSLSSLKNDSTKESKKEFIASVKEASDEKKSSLKDLLNRVANHSNNNEKKEEAIDTVIPPKEEIKQEVKIDNLETRKENLAVLEQKEIVKDEPKELKPAAYSDSWQKSKVKKEVPEDVLRKVLE